MNNLCLACTWIDSCPGTFIDSNDSCGRYKYREESLFHCITCGEYFVNPIISFSKDSRPVCPYCYSSAITKHKMEESMSTVTAFNENFCKKCNHNIVCQHKDEVSRMFTRIVNIVDESPFKNLKVNISCKYFQEQLKRGVSDAASE